MLGSPGKDFMGAAVTRSKWIRQVAFRQSSAAVPTDGTKSHFGNGAGGGEPVS